MLLALGSLGWSGYRTGAPPSPWKTVCRPQPLLSLTSLPASPESPISWLLLSSNSSFPAVWLSGLWDPSRGSGETSLEVLGLGCSGELRDNLASFSSSDSILITFLRHSVWQDFLLFCGVAVLETSCAVGNHSARSGASRGPKVSGGQRPRPGWQGPVPSSLPFSTQKVLPGCHAHWPCLLTTGLCLPWEWLICLV